MDTELLKSLFQDTFTSSWATTAETALPGETSDFNGITQTRANRVSAGGELKRSQPSEELRDTFKVEAKLHDRHQNSNWNTIAKTQL